MADETIVHAVVDHPAGPIRITADRNQLPPGATVYKSLEAIDLEYPEFQEAAKRKQTERDLSAADRDFGPASIDVRRLGKVLEAQQLLAGEKVINDATLPYFTKLKQLNPEFERQDLVQHAREIWIKHVSLMHQEAKRSHKKASIRGLSVAKSDQVQTSQANETKEEKKRRRLGVG